MVFNMVELEPGQAPQGWHIWPPFLPCSKNLRNTLIKSRSGSSASRSPTAFAMGFTFFPCCLVQAQGKIENSFAADKRFFVIVTNINIENMDGPIQLPSLIVKIL